MLLLLLLLLFAAQHEMGVLLFAITTADGADPAAAARSMRVRASNEAV
jgi:hypothetical protein